MKTLTASDHTSLLHLASVLPNGDESRRVILAQLKRSASLTPQEATDYAKGAWEEFLAVFKDANYDTRGHYHAAYWKPSSSKSWRGNQGMKPLPGALNPAQVAKLMGRSTKWKLKRSGDGYDFIYDNDPNMTMGFYLASRDRVPTLQYRFVLENKAPAVVDSAAVMDTPEYRDLVKKMEGAARELVSLLKRGKVQGVKEAKGDFDPKEYSWRIPISFPHPKGKKFTKAAYKKYLKVIDPALRGFRQGNGYDGRIEAKGPDYKVELVLHHSRGAMNVVVSALNPFYV